MTAEERMRERAAQVADEDGGVPPENWRVIGELIRALPLEGEDQRVAAATCTEGASSVSAGLVAQSTHHHSRPEQAAAVTASPFEAAQPEHLIPAPAREPSAVEEVAIAFAFGRVAAVARRHAAELDRLRAENAALREQLQGGVVVPMEAWTLALSALSEAEAILGGEYGDTYGVLCETMAKLENALAAAKETKK